MVPSLPRWTWRWAAALPFVAGATNAIALMAFRHGGLTHLTGITTETAMAAVTANANVALHGVLIIASFLCGCGVSAGLTGPARWHHAGRQRRVLGLEAVLLALSAVFLSSHTSIALLLAAFAMGLQNGLSSAATGGLLRTTHLTGMLTDLGTAAGFHRHGRSADRRRVTLSMLVCAMFVSGAISGTLLDVHLGHGSLGIPALIPGVLALLPNAPEDASRGYIPAQVPNGHLSVAARLRTETDGLLDALQDEDLDEARFRVDRICNAADAEGLPDLAKAALQLRRHLAEDMAAPGGSKGTLAGLAGVLATSMSLLRDAPRPAPGRSRD